MRSFLLLAFSVTSAFAGDPSGWRITPGTVAALDHEIVHEGANSLRLQVNTDTFAGANQYVRATAFRGQRIRLSGYVRTRGTKQANLWLRVDGPHYSLDLANDISSEHARAQVLRGDNEWTYVEQVVDVPDSAIGIAFGVIAAGASSEVWLDDLRLETTDIPITGFGSGNVYRLDAAQYTLIRKQYSSATDSPINLNFEQP